MHCGNDFLRFEKGISILLNVESAEDLAERERDSARVHTQILSEYKWASEGSYRGRTLAVHNNLIAYRLFNETTGEVVRVLERSTSKRHLIKV